MKIVKCELCGTPCKIVGKTTMRYEPVITLTSILESMPKKKEEDEFTFCGCNPDRNRGYNQAIDDITTYLKSKLGGSNE